MKPADFAEYVVVLNGEWGDYWGHRRYQGSLLCDVPISAISLLYGDSSCCYTKTGRQKTPRLDIDLVMQPIWEGEAFQPILRIGNEVNFQGALSKDRNISIARTQTFLTGHLHDLAEPDSIGSTIKVLVLADEDLRSRRLGIWSVKRMYEDQLFEPWSTILTKTRHGHVDFSESFKIR